MSWLEDITSSIKYIEGHLTDELTLEKIAAKINLSPFYFQKGFSILCGITVSEYIRNRRLSLAGRDLQTDGVKVIDVAMKYGYDSPDSFTKAFTRFHGITPAQAKSGDGELKNYLPFFPKFLTLNKSHLEQRTNSFNEFIPERLSAFSTLTLNPISCKGTSFTLNNSSDIPLVKNAS